MRVLLNRVFKFEEVGSDIRTEIRAGTTTFMTMAYIIFVQPAVLSAAGMDFGAVLVATCLSSAVATFLMAFLANYPIALAPAMGHNFFFVFTVVLAMKIPWQSALGAIFISGFLFLILSFFGFREMIITAVPESLKNAIAVGIGLLIAVVGLEWSGLVVDSPGTLVTLGNLKSPPVLLSLFGVAVISTLLCLRVKGAILLGIVATALAGLLFGMVRYQGLVSTPPSLLPTLFKLDILGAIDMGLFSVIFIFFFLDLFDTVGTLIGVSQEAGFMVDGKLPRAKEALLADAIGTVEGALLGTTTVTSYIESASGVAEGGRTGLANIVTASFFLLALFFYPLAKMIGGGVEISPDHFLYPVTAPVLIIIGSIMLRSTSRIPWKDYSEAIPAFLTLITMPLTFSITEGIAFGFISYSLLKLVSGKGKDVHWLIYLFAVLFVIRYAFFQ
jgi:AGZA family xanthine/uracil permease-like MFS transporter